MPTHIKLTVTGVINFTKNGPQYNALPKPLEIIVPLTQLAINKAGDSDFAEVSYNFRPDGSWRCAEYFTDVVEAMAEADDAATLIRVPLREKVEAAVAQAFPMPQKAGEMSKVSWADIKGRALHEARPGDLRIVPCEGGVWIERAEDMGDGNFTWGRKDVPTEVRHVYGSRDDAMTALRLAGYLRLLVDDCDDLA